MIIATVVFEKRLGSLLAVKPAASGALLSILCKGYNEADYLLHWGGGLPLCVQHYLLTQSMHTVASLLASR